MEIVRSRSAGPLLAFVGLAAFAASAHAQAVKGNPPTSPPPVVAPANPDPVAGVTVNAPTSRSPLANIPPDKLAEFEAQAARDEAFRKYRGSTPPLTADPNDQSKDFPGLQAYVPK